MINQFAITTQKDPQGRFAIIHTDGYINNLAGEKIGEVASLLMAEGYTRLIINLEKSTVINSIGISILIEIIEKMQEIHGLLAFCNLTKTIHKTFTIMGLAQYAALYEDQNAAIRGVLEA